MNAAGYVLVWFVLGGVTTMLLADESGGEEQTARHDDPFSSGEFQWYVSLPLIGPAQRPEDPCHAIKDPSIVRYKGRWHLFCTIRSQIRSHQIEYLSFADWDEVDRADRHVLTISDGYFCAPQVFYFEPHRKWYLVYQVVEQSRKPSLQPAYSTSGDIADPDSWTAPRLLFDQQPDNVKAWIDFWVICDDRNAHLLFTSMDGRLWRSQTNLASFPGGWTDPQVVLEADIFEASHTYRLRGQDRYVTIVEARTDTDRRYYKAYVAERLDGSWAPLADSRRRPFVGRANTHHVSERWAESFSHGELIRAGYNQRLEIDPADLRMLFQGVSDEEREGKPYGAIPWRLGLLTAPGVVGSAPKQE